MRLYHFLFPQCRFAAAVSAIALLIASSSIVPAPQQLVNAATNLEEAPSAPDNQTGLKLASVIGPQIQFALGSHNGLEVRGGSGDEDEAETFGLDVIRRAPPDVSALKNNEFQRDNIKLGETQWWYFPKDQVRSNRSSVGPGLPANLTAQGITNEEASDWGGDKTVFISLTTCQKPSFNSTDSGNGSISDLPQLTVHVSQSVERPGPGKDDDSKTSDEGYLSMTVEADGDVYIGVSAPNSTAYSGSYKYQIAASIDTYFHRVESGTFLYFVDADMNSALLTTGNLTQANSSMENYHQWINLAPPYTIFANNANDTSIEGLRQSYCALEQNAQIRKNSNIGTEMTARGLGNKPKQQFHVKDLNASSTYLGILAMNGNSSASGNGVVNGGGRIFQPMNLTTKADGNCAVIFGLNFCSEVSYAVPSNPRYNAVQLQSIYDGYAAAKFKNFSYSLQQIQCNASAESMFSLAVNCDDCSSAYKEWLCSVTIPRCEDYSSSDSFLQPRNAGQDFFNGTSLDPEHPDRKFTPSNRSRSSLIDSEIRPGPYKEVLPCQDVCHNLVRSCPSKLQFSCPQGRLLNTSYGQRTANGYVTCNYMGAAYYLNAARKIHEGLWFVLYALGVFWSVSWIHA